MNKQKARREFAMLIGVFCVVLISIVINSEVNSQFVFTFIVLLLLGVALQTYWNRNLK